MNTAQNLHHVNAWENTWENARENKRSPERNISRENMLSSISPTARPSGIPQLDAILPHSGWPKGAIVEVVVPDTFCDSISFLLPTLAQLSGEGRWLGLQALPYRQSLSLLSENSIDPARTMQVNQHPGRSGLWTLEQMLRSGIYSAVVAWPECNTDLMARRLQKAATIGKSMAFLFRTADSTQHYSRIDLRIKLEVCDDAMTAVLLDCDGEQVSEIAIIGRC